MGRVHVSRVLCALAASVIWVGCAHRGASGGGETGETGDAAFSISYPDATTPAQVGKRYNATPEGRCNYENGREARWSSSGAKVTSGELPPGMRLEDGVIGGVPTQAGTFAAHIEFSGVVCAGKPLEGQGADVSITVK